MKITSINKQNHAILTLENIVNRAYKSGNRMGEEGGGNERQGVGGKYGRVITNKNELYRLPQLYKLK